MRKRGQDAGPLLAIASGLLSGLAFPPFGIAGLALVAPVPLLAGLADPRRTGLRRAFTLGWIAALLHFLLLLHWILWLPSEEVTIPGLMIPALLFMASYLALFFGAAALGSVWVSRRLRLPLGLVWPVLVTLADILRSSGELAFPWGSPGYALASWTPALQFTSITGFWGLVLWVQLLAGLAWEALRAAGLLRARAVAGAAAAVLFLAPWVHGSIVLSQAPRDTIDGPAGIDVAILQPNTSREIKWDPRYREIVIDDLLRRTREAGEKRPDLIVWPETAVPMVLLQEPVYLAQVEETVRAIHTPLLAGTLDYERTPDGYLAHNSAALFGADGRLVDRYDKQRLVPFSERMPFQKQAPWLSSLNFGQSDFSPGSRYVLFPVERARIGVLICFESIFPELAQRFVAHGANLLVNITNDFWFGDTAAPVQHAEMAIFRAVETRTPLLRCANTGISMVVDPWGRVSHQTRTFVEARIDVRVRTVDRPRPPFHVRHGAWLTIALTGLGGGLLGAAFLARGGSTA